MDASCRFVVACLVALGAALLAACGDEGGGEDAVVDGTKAVEVLTQSLENGGLTSDQVSDVSCPSDVPNEAGRTFPCDVTLVGMQTTVRMRVEDDDGTLEVRTAQVVLDTATVEGRIEDEFDQDTGTAVSAQCSDDEVIKVDNGGTFECTVEDSAGATQTITVTTMNDGAYSFDTPAFG